MSKHVVRPLGPADADSFRLIRLEALRAHPDHFGSSWEEAQARPSAWFEENAGSGRVVGLFDEQDALAGMAGLALDPSLKSRHLATLWGMYVAPSARRQGAGAALVHAVLAMAVPPVEEVRLTVSAHNGPAIALYERLGFERYGLDPHALKLGDRYIDELLMRRVLR